MRDAQATENYIAGLEETLGMPMRVPHPLDIEKFCQTLAAARGRPIILIPLGVSEIQVCGMWISTPLGDHIAYPEHTSATHKAMVVLHEIGHILRDTNRARHQAYAARARVPIPIEDVMSLMPTLSPDMVRRALARTCGRAERTGVEEQEVEDFATMILTRSITGWVEASGAYPIVDTLAPHQRRPLWRRLTPTRSGRRAPR